MTNIIKNSGILEKGIQSFIMCSILLRLSDLITQLLEFQPLLQELPQQPS